MTDPVEQDERDSIVHALDQLRAAQGNDWLQYRRLVMAELKRLNTSYLTLAELVNHRNEMTETRLVVLEEDMNRGRGVTIRQEISLDARKLAVLGGFFSIITVLITVVSRIFWG